MSDLADRLLSVSVRSSTEKGPTHSPARKPGGAHHFGGCKPLSVLYVSGISAFGPIIAHRYTVDEIRKYALESAIRPILQPPTIGNDKLLPRGDGRAVPRDQPSQRRSAL